MKLHFLILASLTSLALAQLAKTMDREFNTIINSLDSLTNVLKALKDDAATKDQQIKSTNEKSDAVEAAIKHATASLRNSTEKLGMTDVSSTTTTSNTLLSKTNAAIDALIQKKPVIVKYGQQQQVKKHLSDQKAASDELTSAVVEKMPAALQGIAKGSSAKIGQATERGLKAFS